MEKNNHLRVVVRANYLAAAALFRSSESTRYYLNGVCIEPRSDSGVTLISGDGHRAVFVRDSDGQCEWSGVEESKILSTPPELLKHCKTMGRDIAQRWAVYGPKTVHVVYGKTAEDALEVVDNQVGELVAFTHLGDTLIAASYPDVRRCCPPRITDGIATNKMVSANAAYLADFGAAGRLLSGNPRQSPAVSIVPPAKVTKSMSDDTLVEGQGPMWVSIGHEDLIGVLMPMRLDTLEIDMARAGSIIDALPRPVEHAIAAE